MVIGALMILAILGWLGHLVAGIAKPENPPKHELVREDPYVHGEKVGTVIDGPVVLYNGIGLVKISIDPIIKGNAAEYGVLVNMAEDIKAWDKVKFVVTDVYNHSQSAYTFVRLAKKVK